MALLNPVSIVIAEDMEIIRMGLRALLESAGGIKVTGEAANGREALEKVRQHPPDVVLMDLSMPEMDGTEAIARMKKSDPGVKIIVLTVHDQDQIVYDALNAGADGYLLKDTTLEELQRAIAHVMRGDPYFSQAISPVLLKGYLKSRVAGGGDSLDRLSDREREVLKLLADGVSQKEISDRLFISTKTVESHRSNMLKKLGVQSTAELIVLAVRGGLSGK